MFGWTSCIPGLPSNSAFDTGTYPSFLRSKLDCLQDIVELNVAQASHSQQLYYYRSAHPHQFHVGDSVWLSVPTAGKLDPRWEGQWEIQSIKSAATYKISDWTRIRVVHANRLRHRYQPLSTATPLVQMCPTPWLLSFVNHEEITTDSHLARTAGGTSYTEPHYPQRTRRPPHRLHT